MRIIFGILLFTLFAAAPAPNWREEVRTIDSQIEQLVDLQDKLKASARRHVNDAMRWQFQNENSFDARRAWDQAAQDKQKIQEIQDQIDDLKRRKEEILKEHGSQNAP